jgi:hypothetical protein
MRTTDWDRLPKHDCLESSAQRQAPRPQRATATTSETAAMSSVAAARKRKGGACVGARSWACRADISAWRQVTIATTTETAPPASPTADWWADTPARATSPADTNMLSAERIHARAVRSRACA